MDSESDLKSLVSTGQKISRPSSLADIAAGSLREMILLEKLAPGRLLPERELSEAMGISRTPLRDAMKTLANEGLIEYSIAGRPRVADPSINEIADYLRVQGVLEALAGELACVVASDTEITTIRRLNEEMVEFAGRDEPLDDFRRDMAFHNAIVAASHNKPLVKTHATYNARLWRARFMSSQRLVGRESTQAEHAEIVEALTQRDAVLARQALKKHLTTAEDNIHQALLERQNSHS